MKELTELVRAHRLVTLTGVGGVGKTRLAVQVAAELAGEFRDGVWLVELAPVGDPAAVPDVVAAVLGITPQAGLPVTHRIAQALSGRRAVVGAGQLRARAWMPPPISCETVLGRTGMSKVLATSREGVRVGGRARCGPSHRSTSPAGATSAAVELFVERAQAVVAGFVLGNGAETTAVMEICRRLDGIALAIELAAARMVSMSPQDVLDRLE